MGRKQNNKKVKKDESSEHEVSEEELDQDHEGEFQDGDFDDEMGEDFDGDSVLLKRIEDRILEVDNDEEKLSWAAIYQVKKQQAELNDQMQKEIDTIKEKYQAKRFPLMTQIAEAVAGKKLQKSIYTDNEFVKSINLNKTKPKALRDYWGKVFESCGLIGNEDDIELLEKLTAFRCQLLDVKVQNIKLIFEFEDNEYFGNTIEIEVSGSVAEGNFTKKLTCASKGKLIDQNSLFGLLTGKDSDDQELSDTCHDLYRAYVSSTYFYFYDPADDVEEDGDDEGEDDEQEDGEQDQESEENGKDVKAVKKQKGSAITQKPECKQQ